MKNNEKKVVVFRHGPSRYWQGNKHCHGDAFDLACERSVVQGEEEGMNTRVMQIAKAIGIVWENALCASHFLSRAQSLEILSSPVARCVHTANVIHEALRTAMGFRGILSVVLDDELDEVQGFSWEVFNAICLGGTLKRGGYEIEIDSGQTNPRRLSLAEFFRNDAIHLLPQSVTKYWPAVLLDEIAGIERVEGVAQRFKRVLTRVLDDKTVSQTVLVTHDALIGHLVGVFTRGQTVEVPTGSFVVLRGDASSFVVERGLDRLPVQGRIGLSAL